MSNPPTRLTPDLYVAQSDYFQTNSGVFLSRGEAVLIDPCMRPDEIDRIGRFVADQAASPHWLVLTHSHWDHILGPERFPGVPTVAQARYREVAERDAEAIRQEIAKWEAKARPERPRTAPFVIPL